MQGNYPYYSSWPYYYSGYYYPEPTEQSSEPPQQSSKQKEQHKKVLNPSAAIFQMKKKLVTEEPSPSKPPKPSAPTFNQIVKKKYQELEDIKKQAALKAPPVKEQKKEKPLPKKAVAVVKAEDESGEVRVEITEKAKKKTTLKKKIAKERERKAFLQQQEGEAKLNTEPLQIATPTQLLEEEKKHLKDKKVVREYVDQILTNEIDINVTNLVFALRKQYVRQKLEKPGKKIQKNYVFGIKEVLKHIEAKNVKALIVAPNIEKIECEGGLDTFLEKMFKMCRAQKVPIVFALTMSKLGLIAKSKGTRVALLGILRYIGNEELFKIMVESAEEARKEFYQNNKERIEALRGCAFLAGSPYLM